MPRRRVRGVALAASACLAAGLGGTGLAGTGFAGDVTAVGPVHVIIRQTAEGDTREGGAPGVEPEAAAEPDPADAGEEPGADQGGVDLPEDAATRRRLSQAVRLAENGRPEDAAHALGRLAESVGDAEVFVRDGRSLRSARAEIQRLIGDAAPEVRAAYEQAFGPAARRMVEDSSADPDLTLRVAIVYPRTRAGATALYRVAATRADEGALAEAAAWLQRLAEMHPEAVAELEPAYSLRLTAARLRRGDRAGADAALAAVVARRPEAVAAIGGEPFPLAASPPASIREFLGATSGREPAPFTPHPGDAEARRPEPAEPFLVPRWSVVLPGGDAAVDGRRTLGATAAVRFPAVVGDLVLVPTGAGFDAFDVRSGERLWGYPSPRAGGGPAHTVRTGLSAARLSTDGRAIFLVEEQVRTPGSSAPDAARAARPPWGFPPGRNAFAVPNLAAGVTSAGAVAAERVLTALDVTPPRQANRLWQVGGADGGDEPDLAGFDFLGPPLASGGRLYAVVERDRRVRLIALDPSTGRLDWSLDLAHAEVPLEADPQRRSVGGTPTLARGTLLCPTGGGSLVTIDLAGPSLLWGFRYPRTSPPAAAWDGNVAAADRSGWADGTVRVAGERVVLTPPEAEAAYCLDLRTGELLWRRPRGEDLFVASVDAERVVFVGPAGAATVKASDGSPIGTAARFPDGTAPAGQGLRLGGACVLPLSDGSLWRLDSATGAEAGAVRSSRGASLGNLVWHGRTMIALGPDALRAFDGRAALEAELAAALAARADDPDALLRRADLHADAGRYAGAIADCRSAFRAAPSPRTRNRLVAALLDGVREGLPDAAAFDAELDELSRRE